MGKNHKNFREEPLLLQRQIGSSDRPRSNEIRACQPQRRRMRNDLVPDFCCRYLVQSQIEVFTNVIQKKIDRRFGRCEWVERAIKDDVSRSEFRKYGGKARVVNHRLQRVAQIVDVCRLHRHWSCSSLPCARLLLARWSSKQIKYFLTVSPIALEPRSVLFLFAARRLPSAGRLDSTSAPASDALETPREQDATDERCLHQQRQRTR